MNSERRIAFRRQSSGKVILKTRALSLLTLQNIVRCLQILKPECFFLIYNIISSTAFKTVKTSKSDYQECLVHLNLLNSSAIPTFT